MTTFFYGHGGAVPWGSLHDQESRLATLTAKPTSASAVIGERHKAGAVRLDSAPPEPAGRQCQACPTILSQWNTDVVCGSCRRANRYRYPPIDFDKPAVVYYATAGDLIKIGTSTNIDERIRCLGVDLIITEPGGFAEEAARHRQFAHLMDHGEYFKPGPDLLDHIEALRATEQEAAA